MVHSLAAHGDVLWAAHAGGLARIDWAAPDAAAPATATTAESLTRIGLTPCARFVVGLGAAAKTALVLDADTLAVRAMHTFPKRPSAWAVAGDRLMVADKFGDVYSVALLDPAAEAAAAAVKPDAAAEPEAASAAALAANQAAHNAADVKPANVETPSPRPAAAAAASESAPAATPILGHVSMVLALAATPDRILSADRDEHIRVSELPRAFVIERFLLGHTEYVAHLALAGAHLLSGGGDRFVVAWDWRAGRELARLDVANVLGKQEPIDVCALAVQNGTAWIAVEGESRVVSAPFPALQPATVVDVGAPVLDLAADPNAPRCFAAVPTGVVELGKRSRDVGAPSDAAKFTQTHLRKTARH